MPWKPGDYRAVEMLLLVLLPRPRYIGYCFRSISLFVCMYVSFFLSFFLSLLARLRENGCTDLHEIFRESVEWPWDNLIQFWVKSEKPCDAETLISFSSFVNITSKRLDKFAWNFQGRCGVTMGWRDSIFCQFGETMRYRDANFFVSNITSKPLDRFAWNFQEGVEVWDNLITFFVNSEKPRDAQHGDGVCCAFAPQLVFFCLTCHFLVTPG